MKGAPKGMRLHIGLFGRRNVGKSSLLNALTHQQVSIVSDVPGTTTDPVEKPMELLPLGPVLFIDTAGLDDIGSLGRMRAERTRSVFARTDLGILVAEGDQWGEFEEAILAGLREARDARRGGVQQNRSRPAQRGSPGNTPRPQRAFRPDSGQPESGMLELREALIRSAPEDFIDQPSILGDLIPPGELVVLVVPIDLEAPREG